MRNVPNKENLDALVGAQILQYRLLNSLTQQELADMSGVSKASIVSIETGRRKPSFKMIVKIAKCLNIDWQYLTISPVREKIDSLEISNDEKESLIELLDGITSVLDIENKKSRSSRQLEFAEN